MNSIDTTLMKWFDSDPMFGKIIDDLVSEYIDLNLELHHTNTIYELTPAVLIGLVLLITNNIVRKIPARQATSIQYTIASVSQFVQNISPIK